MTLTTKILLGTFAIACATSSSTFITLWHKGIIQKWFNRAKDNATHIVNCVSGSNKSPESNHSTRNLVECVSSIVKKPEPKLVPVPAPSQPPSPSPTSTTDQTS